MNRRQIFQTVALGAAGAATQAAASQSTTSTISSTEPAVPLAGAWRLILWETLRSNGQSLDFLMGPRPTGLIMYQPNGYMAIQVMHDPRPMFAERRSSAATSDELKNAYFGYFAYWGTYTINEAENAVEHNVHSSLFPEEVGRKYTRTFRLDGRKLVLTTPAFEAGLLSAPPDLLEAARVRVDEELVNRLTWERIE